MQWVTFLPCFYFRFWDYQGTNGFTKPWAFFLFLLVFLKYFFYILNECSEEIYAHNAVLFFWKHYSGSIINSVFTYNFSTQISPKWYFFEAFLELLITLKVILRLFWKHTNKSENQLFCKFLGNFKIFELMYFHRLCYIKSLFFILKSILMKL